MDLSWLNSVPEPLKSILIGAAGDFMGGMAADIAGGLIGAASSGIRRRFQPDPQRLALNRAIAKALYVTVSSLSDDVVLKQHYLTLLGDWIGREPVTEELCQLVDPRPELTLDMALLRREFQAAGYEPDLLGRGVLFDEVVACFVAAFRDAAAAEDELEGPIKIGLLRTIADRAEQQVQHGEQQVRLLERMTLVLERMGPAPPDRSRDLKAYRQELVKRCRYLPLRGLDVRASDPSAEQKPLRLAQVYVELNTETRVSVEPKRRRRKGEERLEVREETRPLTALQAATGNQKSVLLGDPGSGKSTFVNHLALCLAAHALEPAAGWLEHLRGWRQPDVVPILVVLRDFARWLVDSKQDTDRAEPRHIWEFIRFRLQSDNLDTSSGALHEALEQGQALVLFDGLDEIAGRVPVSFVRDAVLAFSGRYDKSRYLVTCRTLSYQSEDSNLAGFPAFELAPFDEGKINRFVEAWYGELVDQSVIAPQELDGQVRGLKEALRRPDLWRLADNPLLLTVMALVHTHKGRLPDARARLYKEAVEMLLLRWEEFKTGGAADEEPRLRQLLRQAGREAIDLEWVLWRLAFEAHEQGDTGNDPTAVAGIGEYRLLKELAGLCCQERNMGWAQEVVEVMKLRTGLLLERQPGVFSFPHRTFQEYLAGSYLAQQTDFAKRGADLAAQGAKWREVLLLAAGKSVYVDGDPNKPLTLVAELCPGRERDDPVAWRKAWLAGDVLLEIGLHRVRDSNLGRDQLERVQSRLKGLLELGRLAPVERSLATDTLARLGDPRSGVGLDANGLPGIAWCDVPEGEFTMGDGSDEHPESMDQRYQISKYPITNAQYDAFVRDGGYTENRRGCWTDAGWAWKGDREGPAKFGGAFDLQNHPVVRVTWYEAHAFAQWLGRKLERSVSLPTEAQWEKAARGTDGQAYPWLGEITPDHANYDGTGIGSTSAVGIFPKGASPYGVLDMSGNVWEWCLTKWRENYTTPPDEQAEDEPNIDARRVLRGGSCAANPWGVRCAVRDGSSPDLRGSTSSVFGWWSPPFDSELWRLWTLGL